AAGLRHSRAPGAVSRCAPRYHPPRTRIAFRQELFQTGRVRTAMTFVRFTPEFKMEDQILRLLGRRDYVPANVPELLRQLRWLPNRQQELQQVLAGLERSGRITRTKGNRYIQSREADLIPGRIRINRQGKGFLQPDDPALKEIMIPEGATSTALHEDRVLVRRDVKARGLRPERLEQETGAVIRILERKRTQIVGTLQRGREFLYVIP